MMTEPYDKFILNGHLRTKYRKVNYALRNVYMPMCTYMRHVYIFIMYKFMNKFNHHTYGLQCI